MTDKSTPLHLTREALLHTARQHATMIDDHMHTLVRSQRIIAGIRDDDDRAAAWRAHAELAGTITALMSDLVTIMTDYVTEVRSCR